MERAVAIPPARRRALALPRVAGWQALSLVVAASAVVRTAAAFARQTPMYFPDEYLYSELGRSIATVGRPLVRGQHSTFPALLQPILTAPAWLLGDVADSYHAIQLANALAMSLAAVPAYLLARRVGVSERLAVVVAALALLLPDLVYAGWVLSEPFAYPLALLAAWLGVRALDRPTAAAQLAFLGAAGLASFARAQLLVLPLCFVLAAVLMDVRERQLLWTVRRQYLVVGAVALAAVVFLARGSQTFGQYGQVLSVDASPAALAHRVATQGLALLYGSGLIVIPGAVLGLAGAFARPRTRAELALSAFAVPFTVALVLQAALWGDTGQMQERYVFYAVPLLAVGFAVHAGRGWPWWRAYGLLSAALLVLAATVPLSGYAVATGKEHAPFLFAVTRAEELFGLGGGSLVVALVAGVLAVAAALLARSRRGTMAVTALVLAAPAAAAFAASSYDLRYDAAVRRDYLPADRSWVDHARLGDVALVYSKGIPKEGLEQLFWNRSVKRILLLPGAPPLDAYGADRLSIARDGTLLVGGRPLRQPLLVDGGAAVIALRGAEPVADSQAYALWKPAGNPRLAWYAAGWYRDGWLGNAGSFRLWGSHIAGHIRFTVHRTHKDEAATLWVRTPAGRQRIHVLPGETRTVELAACGTGRWRATFSVDHLVLNANRLLGMRATKPLWAPNASACK